MSDDIYDPWDDTQPGYYDNAVQPAQREPTEPVPPTAKTVDLTAYQARCAQLWVDYRAGWCECDLCLIAHKPQPGKKRDPITGNGCKDGAEQWGQHQANLNAARDEFLPHGHPETARRGCKCAPCVAAREAGTLPPGVAHGLVGYQRYNCKCEVCKLASAAYRKEMRDRKAAVEQAQAAVAAARDRQQRLEIERLRQEINALRARGNG